MAQFEELLGKTITTITNDSSEVIFTCSDGSVYRMYHSQDCCEYVTLEDVSGDFSDLLNQPILLAEEISNGDYDPDLVARDNYNVHQWTFYKLATNRGYVTMRWYGTSNGYYSTAVDFDQIA